jgi:hypothetical protein
MPTPAQHLDVRLPDGWTHGVLTWWREMPDGKWYGRIRPLNAKPAFYAPEDVREVRCGGDEGTRTPNPRLAKAYSSFTLG